MDNNECFLTIFTVVKNPFVKEDTEALICSEDVSTINKKYMEYDNKVYRLKEHATVTKKGEIHIKATNYQATKTIISLFDNTENIINDITADVIYCSDNIIVKERVMILTNLMSSPVINNDVCGADGFKVKITFNTTPNTNLKNIGRISRDANVKVINSNGLVKIIDKIPIRNSQDCVIYIDVSGTRNSSVDNCINNNIYIDSNKLIEYINEQIRMKNSYLCMSKHVLAKSDNVITLTITDHNLYDLHNTLPTAMFTITPECKTTIKLNFSSNVKQTENVINAKMINVMITSGEIDVYELHDVKQIII